MIRENVTKKWIIRKDYHRCPSRQCIGADRYSAKIVSLVEGDGFATLRTICRLCGEGNVFRISDYYDARPCIDCGFMRSRVPVRASVRKGDTTETWNEYCQACEYEARARVYAEASAKFARRACEVRKRRGGK